MKLLEINGLDVSYRTAAGPARAVRQATLALERGETLGLVGESGCGKTTLALALLGLLPASATMTGSVKFGGEELVGSDARKRQSLAWTQIAYVPQSAMNSLDPTATLGRQFERIWLTHNGGTRAQIREKAQALFREVELEATWLDSYPHELSGGMRQRAIMAFALMFEPQLLLADEPTTGLDVIVQRQILSLLNRLRVERNMAMIFVSHDVGAVAEMCQSVAVMYAGTVAEKGPSETVLLAPHHPYTMGLARAFPDIRDPLRPLVSIPGAPPRLDAAIPGCAFAPRCPFAQPRCEAPPPRVRSEGGAHEAACWRAGEAALLWARSANVALWGQERRSA